MKIKIGPLKFILLLVLAGVLVLFGTVPMVAEISTCTWPSTMATVERTSASDTYQNSKYFGYKILRNTTYEYSFTADGRVFHGVATISKALFPKEETIPVRFKANKPSESKIDLGLNIYLLGISALMILGALAILWYLALGIKRTRPDV